MPLPKSRVITRQLARELVADLITRGRSTLELQGGLDLTGSAPAVAEPAPETVEEPTPEELELREAGVKAERSALSPSWLTVYVGGGPSFRSLGVQASGGPVIPQSPAIIASLGVAARVFPLLLLPALRESRFAGVWLEGQYRFSLVRGLELAAGEESPCPATDDEVVGRVGWRYRFGGMLPHVGVTVGVANERTAFACQARALDTTYTSTEYHLSLWQPILRDERLALELAGGPRLLFSTRALGFDTFAWSAEGWVSARPAPIFTLRAGARVTGTRLTTFPDGVSLTDLRTFIGVEVGAAL
jgi:hypothetical protein